MEINPSRLKSLLLDLVALKSYSSQEVEMADFLVDEFARFADKVEKQPVKDCGGNVIARIGPEGASPTYLFLAHMDTIELFEGWSRNPWGESEDDRIFGIGALDAKSSLAAMIEAARSLSDSQQELTGEVLLIAICDEEGFSRGSYEAVKGGKIEGIEMGVVGEPTQMNLMKGACGRLVFDVVVKGRAAIGTERRGINAVIEACKLTLWATRYTSNPKVEGSVAPLAIKSQEFIVTHPERCLVRIDRHYPRGARGDEKRKFVAYLKSAEEFTAETEIRLMERPTPFAEPFELLDDDPALRVLSQAYREVLGGEPKTGIYPTVSDANYLNQFGNVSVPILGPKGGNQHSRDEYALFSSVVDLARVYLAAASSAVLPKE